MRTRILLSVSVLAIAVSLPGVANAQSESSQIEAERANRAADCATLSDPAAREACLDGRPTSNIASGAPESDAIIVTGSRIVRPNFDTTEPSVVINSEQIEARGFETLGQALNELPAFGVPGSSPVGGQSSFGPGQSFVNFLGLGSERTLTLVNGRRFVGSNTASIFGPTGQGGNQVDLNVIPTKLIERVETIVIGGAPIYGSDAIAGTVNVILKRDYEGVELDAQYGISERGDGANYRFRALAGTNLFDGRLNVVASGEYNKGEGLVAEDRPELYRGGFYARSASASDPILNRIYLDRRIPSLSEFGVPVRGDYFSPSPEQVDRFFGGFQPGFVDAQGRALRFDATGNLIPIDFGAPTGIQRPDGLPQNFVIDFAGGNGFSLIPTTNLLTDTERYSGNLLLSFELTSNIRLFGEGWYSRSQGVNLRDQPEYNSYLFGYAGDPAGAIVVSVDNPFLTPQAAAIIQAQALDDVFYVNRANTDLVSGRAVGSVEIQRYVAGIDGNFAGLGGRTWNFEIVGNYGRSETNGRVPTLATQNFFNAVNAVRDASGNIVCAPGAVNSPAETISSTCAPLNIFGNQTSQAARDYITAIARPESVNEQKVFTASLSGPLFRLPGGDFSFALGYEHREESQNFDPGAFFSGGDDPDPLVDSDGDGNPANDRVAFGQSVVIQPVNGRYNTDEIFGELRAGLINSSNNIPFIYSFELQGAARYVDHSVAGGDLTWTAGASWQPVRDVTVRGNFTRAIRSPFITEAFNPSSSFFGFATDPCDETQLGNGPAPATRAANCAAAGLPADFSSLSSSRSFLQAVAGNPELSNEKSDAFTVGAVIRPRFVPGFTASIDYVDITVNDVISQLSGDQVAANCYDNPDFPNNEFCDRLTRDDDGQLSFIETGYFNAAELRYKGILASVDYRVPTPFIGTDSRVGLNVSYQYLDTLSSRANENAEAAQTNESLGYSRHSAVGTLDYTNGGANLYAQVNFTGPARLDANEAPNFRTPNKVNAIAFLNMGASYRIDKQFSIRFVVDNVLDQEPPYPLPIGGGTVSYFPGVLGRYFRLGASVGF